MIGKRLVNTGEAAVFDPLQNFETVTYTGNGGTQKITGYIRKGAAFNGSSSVIDLGSNLGIANNSFSFSFWINANNKGSDHYFIGDTATWGSNSLHIGILSSSAKLRFSFGSTSRVDSSSNIVYGTWQHWVCTYNAVSNTSTIYLNGSSDNSASTSTDYAGTSNIQLGDISLSGYNYDGKLDQVRIFNKALNPTEVGELALETYADPKKSITDYFGNGSGVALYELDEDANDTGPAPSTVDTVDIFGDNSLTDYYKLDGDLTNEKSGGTSLQSGSSTFGDGILGQALYLNGTQTASQTSTSYGSMNITGSYSISFYFKATVGSKRNMLWYLENIGGYSNQTEFGSDNRIYFGGATITSQTYSANTWYHLAMSFNASTGLIKAYINGQSIGSRTANSSSGSTQCFGHGGVGLTGYIDQVRIFNKIISDSNAATLYEATTYNGTPTNVNFLGMAFQPDLVWIKGRTPNSTDHVLNDSVRGTNKTISSSNTSAEESPSDYGGVGSFDSNGFTTTAGTDTTYAGGLEVNGNLNGQTYVAWCWKAGGSVTPNNNTQGTITSTVSANPDAGFSIVKQTSNNTNDTYGHGLDEAPEMIISKNMDVSGAWGVYHKDLGTGKWLYLNTTASVGTSVNVFPIVNNTVFSGGSTGWNNLTYNYINYCFHSVDGYQKVGSYTGTGVSGNAVTTGFRPRFVMYKSSSSSGHSWVMIDDTRSPSNPRDKYLFANTSGSEGAVNVLNFTDNGFELLLTDFGTNGLNETYIYLAIA